MFYQLRVTLNNNENSIILVWKSPGPIKKPTFIQAHACRKEPFLPHIVMMRWITSHALQPSLISDLCGINVPTKNKLHPHAALRQRNPNKVTVFLARSAVHSHPPCFSKLILGKKSDLFNDCSPAGQTLFLHEDSDGWPRVRLRSTNYSIIHGTKTKGA